MPKLGVNIDHVATIRQVRGTPYPSPVDAARLCENAGCDSIVCHLREDRRHIVDSDVVRLRETVRTRFNLEMSAAPEIVEIACRIKPDQATLVPERREEMTTEAGLDVAGNRDAVFNAVRALSEAGIVVSLFIDPDQKQIDASRAVGVTMVELHTGAYADAAGESARERELVLIKQAARYAQMLGITVNAGHGLHYDNTRAIAKIDGIEELNIGHAVVAYAVLHGLDAAVRRMIEVMR